MIFKRQDVEVIRLQTTGDIAFAPFYQDGNLPDPVAAGELVVHGPDGRALLASRQEAKDSVAAMETDVAMRGRFCAKAVFPPLGGLRIFEPGGTMVALLSPMGDLLVRGQDVSAIPNPGTAGDFGVDACVYAAPGLDYPLRLYDQYRDFDLLVPIPGSQWQTRSIDLSGTCPRLSIPGAESWPFTIFQAPINGLVRVPRGPGPHPLIVFAHGNHTPLENSTPGYLYLCDALASRGFIAATIDVNFLNGDIDSENAARALVQLEHVKQFQIWNQEPGHRLEGKVDLSRIVLVGHSRGGEAVIHASMLNRLDSFKPTLTDPVVPLDGVSGQLLGPYHFALKGLVAIAPTDNQYRPVSPVLPLAQIQTVVEHASYLLIHGTKDADVVPFPGYQAYDRALPYDLNDMQDPASGFKALHWIYGANHNYFNTEWGYDRQRSLRPQDIADVMSQAVQQDYAKSVIGAWAQIHLRRRSSYWDFLRLPASATPRAWPAAALQIVSQYHDRERLWIQTFDESGALQSTRPVTGVVDFAGLAARRIFLAFPKIGTASGFDSTRYLFQHSGGLSVEWTSAGARYRVSDLDFHVDTSRFQVLSLRVGQPATPGRATGPDQDFRIRVTDRDARHWTVQASSFGALPYPDQYSALLNPPGRIDTCEQKMVMQTLRIPLSVLQANGVDVQRIRSVELLFNVTDKGGLCIDDLQLSMKEPVMSSHSPPSSWHHIQAVTVENLAPDPGDVRKLLHLADGDHVRAKRVVHHVILHLPERMPMESTSYALWIGTHRMPGYVGFPGGIRFRLHDASQLTPLYNQPIRFVPDHGAELVTGARFPDLSHYLTEVVGHRWQHVVRR
ncbi:hypothetical protein DBR42_18680 [Pelomonas sp. HMWF004]|nr:hypothetical protein DBR42_18680 [Pelomonas sp. HMWF004]